jgi:ABC-type branched-subunit amino acid transport system permease subunit
MMVIYIRRRIEAIGPVFFTPVMLLLVGILVYFGGSIFGSILMLLSWIAMMLLHRMSRSEAVEKPLDFDESFLSRSGNPISSTVLPILIILLGVLGVAVGFGSNILEMMFLWVTTPGSVFLYRIPVQYYLVLSCLVAVFVFVRRLVVSPFGRMVAAVAQNEERAEALGYNTYLAKIVVVVISGAIAALGGALFAPFIRTIDPPTALGVEISIDAMLYTIIGGLGTLFGPLLGTGVVVFSELNLVDLLGELWLVGLGIVYIIIVLFLPLGVVGSASVKTRGLKERLQRVKLGNIEFGIKQGDYWVFTALGIVALFLTLLFITTL